MEIVDNLFILVVPGAMAAGLATGLFWWSLAVSLAIAFVLTVPVNRWLISRGKGHAVVHELHHSHHHRLGGRAASVSERSVETTRRHAATLTAQLSESPA